MPSPGKTWVHKVGKVWRVDHALPFSGHQYADWDTWERAMQDAWDVEKARMWY